MGEFLPSCIGHLQYIVENTNPMDFHAVQLQTVSQISKQHSQDDLTSLLSFQFSFSLSSVASFGISGIFPLVISRLSIIGYTLA